MELTNPLRNRLLELFFNAPDFDYAVNRVKKLCIKYNTNLHFVNFQFEGCTINEIDDLYCQILSS